MSHKKVEPVPVSRELYAAICILVNECQKHRNCDICPLYTVCGGTPLDMLRHVKLKG